MYKKAFDETIQIFREYFRNYFSLNDILNEAGDIKKLIQTLLLKYPKYKINFLTQIEYILKGENNVTLEREIFHIRTSNFIISLSFFIKLIKKEILLSLFFDKKYHQYQKTFKRKFVCTICYDKFSTNAALNRHLISCYSMTNEM